MKRLTEMRRRLSVLLVLAMLISGESGFTVSAFASELPLAGENELLTEEDAELLTEEDTGLLTQEGSGQEDIIVSENGSETDISDVSQLTDRENTGDILTETLSDDEYRLSDISGTEEAAAEYETADTLSGDEAKVAMKIENGMAQPILKYSEVSANYSNTGSDILRFAVYVETDLDTDLDGYNDLVQAVIQVPRAAAQQQYDAPTIFEASPYFGGTSDGTGFEDKVPKAVYDKDFNEDKLYVSGNQHAYAEGSKISTTALVDRIEKGGDPALSVNNWHYRYEDDKKGEDNYYLSGIYNHDYFLIRGFAVVISAGLGTNGSDGLETCGSKAEAQAFANIVEWIHHKNGRRAFADRAATIPIEADWSNGRVAMRGCSYDGTMAYEVAALGTEGLETIVPEAGISSWYEYSNTQGVSHYGDNKYTTFLAGSNSSRFFGRDASVSEDTKNLCSRLFGYFDRSQQDLAGHYGHYWEKREFVSSNKINASALIVQGLNDYNVRTKQADLMRKAFETNNKDVRLILHQDGHNTLENIQIGDMFYEELLNKWYCHYLLGTDNGMPELLPKVYAQSNIDGSFKKYDDWYGEDKISVSSPNAGEVKIDRPKPQEEQRGDPVLKRKSMPSGMDIMMSGDDPYYTIDDFFEDVGYSAEGVSGDGKNYTHTWIRRVPEEITVQGKAEIHVKAKVDQVPSDGRMVLGAMLYDISEEAFPAYETNPDNNDYVDQITYLSEFISRGEGLTPFDLNVYKQTNVKKKLITKGMIDLGSPGAGYEPYTAVSRNIIANKYYDYTIHMLPTVYTVRPGHYLWLYLIPGMDSINSDVDVWVNNAASYADIPVSSIPEGFNSSDFDEECKEDGNGGRIITEKVAGKEVSQKIITSENKIITVSSNIWIKGLYDDYIYMGVPVKPEFEVYDGTRLLTLNKDYRVSYSRNSKPTVLSGRKAVLTVTFKGEYVKTKKIVKEYSIAKTRLGAGKDPDVLVADAAVAYTGRDQKPAPEIRYSTEPQKVINKGYFKYKYIMTKDVSGNTVSGAVSADCVREPGEYTVIIEPKNDRQTVTGSMTATLRVIKDKRLLLKNARVEFTPKAYVYTGKEIRPGSDKYSIRIKLDGRNYTTLSENTDFKVALSRNNVEPGRAQIVFTAMPGNKKGLAGSVTGSFSIKKGRDISASVNGIQIYYEDYTAFKKSGAVPSWIMVKDGDTELVKGKDYTVSYRANKKLSKENVNAKLIIRGKGKYKGTVTKEYYVVTSNIARLNVSAKDKLMVRNLPKGAKYRYENPVITVTEENGRKLTKNKDYKIIENGYETISANGKPEERGDNKPGMIRVTIEGMGNYFGFNTACYMYYDKSNDLGRVPLWKPIAQKTYTGTEIELSEKELNELLVVGRTKKDPGTFLALDTDFYVEAYKNNVNTGTAKVTLRGKGKYGGLKTVSFKIRRRDGKNYIGELKK